MADLLLEHVSKEFATRGEPLVVLRDISLRLPAGRSLAIMGPSGSGKSTLLHIIGGLDRPTNGRVRLGDEDPFALDENGLARFRNQRVGFVFQDHHLLPQLSALENVLIPALATRRATDDDEQRAAHLIQRVGLSDRRDHRPAELSGGERQRVAIARALLNAPSLILADEPTGNLDRKNAQVITQLLCELRDTDTAAPPGLVVVTHSAEVANQMQQQLELIDGTLMAVE